MVEIQGGVFLFIVILYLALLIGIVVVWMGSFVWVIGDTKKRQVTDRWLWILGVLVLMPAFLPAYLISRPKYSHEIVIGEFPGGTWPRGANSSEPSKAE